MSEPSYTCPLCPASFRRQEHLERHRSCHRTDRPFACGFCQQAFKRTDVLQRHWRTCKSRLRAGADIPPAPISHRPTKRQACDRCARLKKACNLKWPCGTCQTKGYECIYRGARRQFEDGTRHSSPNAATTSGSPFNLSMSDDFNLADTIDLDRPCFVPSDALESLLNWDCGFDMIHYSQARSDPSQSSETLGTIRFGKFQFLDKFTNVTGFLNSFECMRVYEVKQLATVMADLALQDSDDKDASATPISLDFLLIPPPTLEKPEPSRPFSGLLVDGCTDCSSWLSDPLAGVTNELVCRLKHVTTTPSLGSSITITWSALIESICVQFFSPPNIRRYLVYFWSFWYPNCPIIHKPTFDVHNTPYTLLLAMLLIGASFAPDDATSQNAKLWFDSAEELVFADQHFRCAVVHGDGAEGFHLRRDAVKALQGAYLICLLQNWEGDDNSKRRIRRSRFSTVTAMGRELGFSPGSHHKPQSEDGNWERFIAKEEFNRTLSYIFLLDTAFIIFHNTPPKVSVLELNFDPVCPERCFQATTAADCFLLLHDSDDSSPIAGSSITDIVSRICKATLRSSEKEYLAGVGKLNLFIIVSVLISTAFHTLLFHARNTFAPDAAMLPIQHGLTNWKEIWNHHEILEQGDTRSSGLASPSECWKRTGFMEYAPEYWTLAQAMITSVFTTPANEAGSGLGLLLNHVDENGMGQLNRFIRWAADAGMARI